MVSVDSEGLFPDRSYLTALSENVTYPNIGQKRAEQRLQTSGSYHRYHNTQAEYQKHLHSHCHHSSTSRAFRRSLLGRLQVLSFIKHKYHVPVHFHLCIIQRGWQSQAAPGFSLRVTLTGAAHSCWRQEQSATEQPHQCLSAQPNCSFSPPSPPKKPETLHFRTAIFISLWPRSYFPSK